jgi:hypothetical protein
MRLQERFRRAYTLYIRGELEVKCSRSRLSIWIRGIEFSATHHRGGSEAFGGSCPRAVPQQAKRSEDLSEHGHEPAEGSFAGFFRENRSEKVELDTPRGISRRLTP